MKVFITLSTMLWAIGLAKNGSGALRTLANTRLITSGGIAEPSA